MCFLIPEIVPYSLLKMFSVSAALARRGALIVSFIFFLFLLHEKKSTSLAETIGSLKIINESLIKKAASFKSCHNKLNGRHD